jgi:hypothetical protein
VRKLRKAVLGVLNATGAHDPGTVLLRRAPESGLVHPIAFTDELCAHPKGLEHFRRATRDAVGLAQLERAVATLDESGPDGGEGRELRRKHRSGGTAADDQDVDGGGNVRCSVLGAGGCRENIGVAAVVAIQIELHVFCSSAKATPRRLPCSVSARILSIGLGSSRRSSQQVGKRWMVMNDPIGDARPEHVAGAAVVLVPENEQIDIELLRPLQNHPRDVMRGRAHDLAVRLYTGGGQSVDERLHRISVCALASSPAERTPRAPP